MACLRSASFHALRKALSEVIRLADGLTRVVLERLGDQLAVGVEILDALGQRP